MEKASGVVSSPSSSPAHVRYEPIIATEENEKAHQSSDESPKLATDGDKATDYSSKAQNKSSLADFFVCPVRSSLKQMAG